MWMRRFRQRIGNNVGMSGIQPSPSNTRAAPDDEFEEASLYVIVLRNSLSSTCTHGASFYYHGSNLLDRNSKGVLFQESYYDGQWTYRHSPVPELWNYSKVAFALQIAKNADLGAIKDAMETAKPSFLSDMSVDKCRDALLKNAFNRLTIQVLPTGASNVILEELHEHFLDMLGQQDKERRLIIHISTYCR
ncbi:hypothetical protein DFH11DRAFT_294011 [Phellopilus nigrolimitatus]|nr:hypothetical protein DFH11DRAFT_294011 [Phellopilus nigrolimitatus]